MRKALTLTSLLAAGAASNVQGIMFDQDISGTSFENGPTKIGNTWNIPIRWENNDGVPYTEFGAIFTDTTTDPFYQIANLSENVTAYSNDGDDSNNLADYLSVAQSNNKLGFTLDSLGVSSTWSGFFIENNGTSQLTVTSPGGRGSEPFENADYAQGFVQIDDSDLHGMSIVLSANANDQIDLGYAVSGLNNFKTDGFGYQVVPEPSFYAALAGIIALTAVATRRKRN